MINILSIFVIFMYISRFNVQCFGNIHQIKITKCLKQPDTWKKVEKAVKDCQEDVKLNIIKDAFQSVNEDWVDSMFDHDHDSSFNHYEDKHYPSISQASIPEPHFVHDKDPVHHNYLPVHDHHPIAHDHYPIAHDHPTDHDRHPTAHVHHPTGHDHHPTVHDYHSTANDHHPTAHDHHSTEHDHLVHEHSSIRKHQSSIKDQPLSIHDLAHSLIRGLSIQNTNNNHHHSMADHFDSHTPIHDQPLPDHKHSHDLHLNQHHASCHNKHRHFQTPQHFVTSGPQTGIHHTSEHIQHTDLSDTSMEHHQHIDFTDFRKKRDTSDHHYIHPSTVTYHDKRIAGCIMQCIFEKNHAVDELGWPTLDGLVNFYSEGVNEHGYFMATLRAVDYCLKASSAKYHVNRRSTPEKGQKCDVAFDVFDCISDRITEYCGEHHQT